ncbi:DUF2059 domain-containing protein [Gynurincola endophyticus]|uniref:DUF2059 domain-containing protein n=1 Tax=Gynurincola endophyticus TaxID=2479004 RepID=UPI000F8D7166|nr:DUF2059 domain-containing protein [Gynurincola endophyticus]
MKNVILFLCCLFFISSGFAQNDELKSQKIKNLMVLTGAGDIGVQFVTNMVTNFKKTFPDVPVEFWDELLKEMNSNEIIDQVVPIYAKYFSLKEIEALISFYETDLGKKLIRTMPLIIQDSYKVGEEWGEKIAERVVNRLIEKGYLEKN